MHCHVSYNVLDVAFAHFFEDFRGHFVFLVGFFIFFCIVNFVCFSLIFIFLIICLVRLINFLVLLCLILLMLLVLLLRRNNLFEFLLMLFVLAVIVCNTVLIFRHDRVLQWISSPFEGISLFFPSAVVRKELIRYKLLIVDLDAVVHDLGVESLALKLLDLSVGQRGLLVGEERIARSPGEHRRGRSLALVTSNIEALILLLESIEVCVWLVHARVPSLS